MELNNPFNCSSGFDCDKNGLGSRTRSSVVTQLQGMWWVSLGEELKENEKGREEEKDDFLSRKFFFFFWTISTGHFFYFFDDLVSTPDFGVKEPVKVLVGDSSGVPSTFENLVLVVEGSE